MENLPPNTDLSKLPILPNPTGEPPNFVDPPSLAHAILAIGLTMIVVSGFCLVLRLAANLKHIGRLLLGDCMLI